jgi:PTH1 family peptidyl-tRNA hydrolase
VGLGNPGPRYEGTRHNVGFDALERILEAGGGRWTTVTRDAVSAEIELEGRKLTLMKPLSFMNLSGGPVADLVKERSYERREVMIILDDVAIPLGTLRLRERGSDGGHNGLASVLKALGGNDVARLRIGVGIEETPADLAEWVTSSFEASERPVIEGALDRVVDAAKAVLNEGMMKAMSRYNQPLEAQPDARSGQGGTLA